MDPPAAPSATPFPNPKLRLMCSYGGHILPRPHDKSLCYAGGDTRIVAVDRRTTASSLSSLLSHLSKTLLNTTATTNVTPFSLKYQLPDEDLDSLVSVATDDDLHNMIEELDRIERSPKPARVRLFLFPSKPDSDSGFGMDSSKAESWFCDALKSVKIMQQRGPRDGDSGPESIVLETNSSFGSTGSSISMSNLPPIGVEDGGVNGQERKVKVTSPDSIESENSTLSAVSHPQTTIYQDTVHFPSTESGVSFNAVETDYVSSDPASGIHMMKTVPLPPHQVSSHSDQIQHLQQMSYVQTGAHYTPQYSQLPMSAYYPMYYSPLHQSTPNPYQPNPPYPVYFVPVRPTQSYNTPMQCNFQDNATTAPSRPPMHPPITMMAPTLAPVLPESATKVYKPVGATQLLPVPSNQNQPPLMDLSEISHSSQCVTAASIAAANYENEYEDDLAYTQIYKTQPSVPAALLSQYQTMTNAGTVVVSEASKLLHGENVKQQTGTSQPQ
ncbi:protein PAL OF QUIRKY [Rhododendron vialii]|uniref:protein PAL OF QUIRKY n=1 Tax=Rhododendron vialii TaxID=182163 RepID=UPI00265FDBED|nr:protein PAL OF QUIRKY [Rhododendron vialii]